MFDRDSSGAWGCIGTVLGAVISGIFLIYSVRIQNSGRTDIAQQSEAPVEQYHEEESPAKGQDAAREVSRDNDENSADVSAPMSASVAKLWADSYSVAGSEVGLTVHAKFAVLNAKGKPGYVAAYFYSQDGKPLRDSNGSFTTQSGIVSAGAEFKSPYESATYQDYPLFIPYQELHLPPGKYYLRYFVYVFSREPLTTLAQSEEGTIEIEL